MPTSILLRAYVTKRRVGTFLLYNSNNNTGNTGKKKYEIS